ncbi:MAG: hypothetical protein ACTSWY_08545 [Promethearchaeota archaeon]
MPIEFEDQSKNGDNNNMEVSLVSEGESLITARIILKCPSCNYKRIFRNTFTQDKIDLILVSVKIIDWLSCDCGSLFNSEIEFEI